MNGYQTSSKESLKQLFVHLDQILQGLHCHLHAFLIPDHHIIGILLHFFFSCILVLSLHYLYTIGNVGQFIGENHSFLLIIVLFVDELHHFIKVSVLIDLSQVLCCLLCEHVHVLHYLKSILYAFVVKL